MASNVSGTWGGDAGNCDLIAPGVDRDMTGRRGGAPR